MQAPDDRAGARASWPIRVLRLDADDTPELHDTTPEQRIEMMWELVVQAWAVAGTALPVYERHEMPVRIRRLRDQA
jgi:hypothetical protein